jgi:hypothetical protein
MVTNTSEEKNEKMGGMITSLEFFLQRPVFASEDSKRQISDHLRTGGLVLIRDALQEAVALKMFACLDQYSDWKVYEDYKTHFHYHHHNIYEGQPQPAELNWCRDLFGSNPTKSLIQNVSQRDCSGPNLFSASWYLPGDYSLPHNDFSGDESIYRQVAFIWHLTRDWQRDWGGDLFWCPTNRYLTPSFNSLILFNVTPHSFHHVTQVSPYATSKRLAISGWWTGPKNDGEAMTADPNNSTDQSKLLELI